MVYKEHGMVYVKGCTLAVSPSAFSFLTGQRGLYVRGQDKDSSHCKPIQPTFNPCAFLSPFPLPPSLSLSQCLLLLPRAGHGRPAGIQNLHSPHLPRPSSPPTYGRRHDVCITGQSGICQPHRVDYMRYRGDWHPVILDHLTCCCVCVCVCMC